MRENKGSNIIDLPSDYVVIDTETTGYDFEMCEIIEVCAIRYSEGKRIDSFSSLVKPTPYEIAEPGTGKLVTCYVDGFITALTGITDDMLSNAPEINSVIPELMAFIGDSVLIGQNVNFDINFIYDAAHSYCSSDLCNDFIDTLRIARKVFPDLEHHRLSDIAKACGVPQTVAHRSEADCIVTAQCFEAMKDIILSQYTLEEFQKLYHRRRVSNQTVLKEITPTVDQIDDSNPIFGKTVVFTGTLSSMCRKDAFQLVANLGGVPADSITLRTNYLVIGSVEFVKSVKNGKTSKMKKAESYQLKGAEISILSESAFFDLVSDYL